MSTTAIAQHAPPLATEERAPLLTRPLLLRFVSIIGAATSFYLTPRLVSRVGYRLALTIGLVLLGAPAVALMASSGLAVIRAVSIIRGAGFAIVTVAGGALAASVIPPARRGQGLALTGVVSGVPALVSLPLGVWASARWGFAGLRRDCGGRAAGPGYGARTARAQGPGKPYPRRAIHDAQPRRCAAPA